MSLSETSPEVAYLTTSPSAPLSVVTNNNGKSSENGKISPVPIPILRVEQLRDEFISPGSSSAVTTDSEFSDSEANSRLGDFEPPSDELAQQIAEQLDIYFSDQNILKDSFLLKHARRNKEGYVNIKLITSFKKIKTFTKDYRQVAYSVRKYSKVLECNGEGGKVKRLNPLPEYDETKVSRTVLAINLPSDNPTMEYVTSLFKSCGEIQMLQLLKPGSPAPSDIKRHLLKHPYLKSVTCAVVEFEKNEFARKAVALSTPGDDMTEGLKVLFLATKGKGQPSAEDSESESESKQTKKNNKKKNRKHGLEIEKDGMSSGSEGDSLMPRPRSRNGSFGSEKGRQLLSPNNADKQTWPRDTPTNGSTSSANLRRRSLNHPQSPLVDNARSSPKPSPKPSPKASPQASPEMRRRANSGSTRSTPEGSPGSSPWVQRRLQLKGLSPLAKTTSAQNITRIPRGPEEGKGFYLGKGRGKPIVVN